MARIFELLHQSVQLRIELDAAKQQLVDYLARPASSLPLGAKPATNHPTLPVNGSVSPTKAAVEITLCHRLVSSGHQGRDVMDAGCSVRLFNMQHSPSDNAEVDHHLRSSASNWMTSDGIISGEVKFRRPDNSKLSANNSTKQGSKPTTKIVLPTSKITTGRTPSAICQRRNGVMNHQQRAENDDEKENAIPVESDNFVVTWLPPTGVKSSWTRTCTTVVIDDDAVRRGANHQRRDSPANCKVPVDDRFGGAETVPKADDKCVNSGNSTSRFDNESMVLFPSSLENISAISRGGTFDSRDELGAASTADSESILGRSNQQHSPTTLRHRLRHRSATSLNGAFCSSFNADEQAFCSTFCYPLHSTVVGVDVSELDVSALVAEQMRHHQQQNENWRQSNENASWSRFSSGISVCEEHWMTGSKLDDNANDVDDITSWRSSHSLNSHSLCVKCGRFHHIFNCESCPFETRDAGNEHSQGHRQSGFDVIPVASRCSEKRCRSKNIDRSVSRRLKRTSAINCRVSDSSSSDDNAVDVTGGRLRRQMGLKKLYNSTSDDNDAVNYVSNNIWSSDKLIEESASKTSDRDPKPDVISCICHGIVGYQCFFCRLRPAVNGEPAEQPGRFGAVPDIVGPLSVYTRTLQPIAEIPPTDDENKSNLADDATASWNSTTSTTSKMLAGKFRSCWAGSTRPAPLSHNFHQPSSTFELPASNVLETTSPSVNQQQRLAPAGVSVTSANCFDIGSLVTAQLYRRPLPPPRRSRRSNRQKHLRPTSLTPSCLDRLADFGGYNNDSDVLHDQKRTAWNPQAVAPAVDVRGVCRKDADDSEATIHRLRLDKLHHHYSHRVDVRNCSAPQRQLAVDVASSSWSTSTTSGQVHHPSSISSCSRRYADLDDSVIASRLRKRAVVRKLKRFSDALSGTAGGLQLKIFGHV